MDWGPVALTLGALLAAALVGGLIGEMLRLPKVTSYLLVGMILGPNASHLIPHEHLKVLDPLAKLAMALVLFIMGCHFPLVHVRRILRRVLRLSAGELGLTFVLVTAGLLILEWSSGQARWWQAAVLFGALALATAPATTILVLKENRSEGTLTEYTTALVAINNFASIVVFELLFLAVHIANGTAEVPVIAQLARLFVDLGGSIALGAMGGLVISYGCGLLGATYWMVLLVGIMAAVMGLCQTWDLPYLLAFLVVGITVANASDLTQKIVEELDRLTGLLAVVFFVIHGAEMDLKALWKAGAIGAAYIVLRSAGKYFGIYWTATAQHEEPPVRHWLGAALVAQAGAAIALSTIAAERDPELGRHLQVIILGTVVFFEIVGPLLIRHSVIRASEVPLAYAVRHTTTTPLEEARSLWDHILTAAGHNPKTARSPKGVTVQQMMRKNVRGLPWSAAFDEIITFIEHSHDNVIPVMGEGGELAGIINYMDLRDTFFDAELRGLVRAADLAVPAKEVLYPDEPISRAWDLLHATNHDCTPVVSREQPHQLLGMVRRRDLLRLFAESEPSESR